MPQVEKTFLWCYQLPHTFTEIQFEGVLKIMWFSSLLITIWDKQLCFPCFNNENVFLFNCKRFLSPSSEAMLGKEREFCAVSSNAIFSWNDSNSIMAISFIQWPTCCNQIIEKERNSFHSHSWNTPSTWKKGENKSLSHKWTFVHFMFARFAFEKKPTTKRRIMGNERKKMFKDCVAKQKQYNVSSSSPNAVNNEWGFEFSYKWIKLQSPKLTRN